MSKSKWFTKYLENHPEHRMNRAAFMDALRAHGLTVAQMAKEMGINSRTLYRKLNCEYDFTVGNFRVCEEHFTLEEILEIWPSKRALFERGLYSGVTWKKDISTGS